MVDFNFDEIQFYQFFSLMIHAKKPSTELCESVNLYISEVFGSCLFKYLSSVVCFLLRAPVVTHVERVAVPHEESYGSCLEVLAMASG